MVPSVASPVPAVRSIARRALLGLAVASVLAIAVPSPAARAEGEPSAAAGSRWALQFSHGPLKIVTVADATGKESSYHYMTMKVTNKTAFPRAWAPHVVGTTDTPHSPYIAGGFPLALERIRQAEKDPTIELLDGSEFGADKKPRRIAKDETLNVVAVFGPLDPLYDRFKIEVQGLVNPAAIVKVLKYGDKQVILEGAYDERNKKVMEEIHKAAAASGSAVPAPSEEYQEIVERRAFVMEYQRLGDEFHGNDNPIDFVREGWLVLGDPQVVRVIGGTGK